VCVCVCVCACVCACMGDNDILVSFQIPKSALQKSPIQIELSFKRALYK